MLTQLLSCSGPAVAFIMIAFVLAKGSPKEIDQETKKELPESEWAHIAQAVPETNRKVTLWVPVN